MRTESATKKQQKSTVPYQHPFIKVTMVILESTIANLQTTHDFLTDELFYEVFHITSMFNLPRLSKTASSILGYTLIVVPLLLYVSLEIWERLQNWLDPPPQLVSAEVTAIPSLASIGPLKNHEHLHKPKDRGMRRRR